jgi:hypothetical protein
VALLESYRNGFDERGEALAEVGASGPKQCGEARKLRFETALRGCTIRARVRLKEDWLEGVIGSTEGKPRIGRGICPIFCCVALRATSYLLACLTLPIK